MAARIDADLFSRAKAADAADPLGGYRAAFDLPADTIYLDGNSLGPLTHAARDGVSATVDTEWGRGLVGSWNTADWIGLAYRVGAMIAPLIGAAPEDVICCDSTSVNLYKVLGAALAKRPGRRRIVAERDNFPTDLYIADQAARRAGPAHHVQWLAPGQMIEAALDEDVAVLMLTHVDYRTGAMHDMAGLTRAAHAAGALVVWDLAHSAGAIDLDVAGCDVDFAIGCGYKYLNGGPGAPAFIYAAPVHQADIEQPLTGWFAHAAPFDFSPGFESRAGIGAFLTGTPGILGMRCLEAALSIWRDVELSDIRDKSLALGALFVEAVATSDAAPMLALASPPEPSRRGSQVSFHHPAAHGVMQALIADGVIGDMRAPDILRFGFAPLYTRYIDVVRAADRLAAIVVDGRFESAAAADGGAVT